MARNAPQFDWHDLANQSAWRPAVSATRLRLRWLLMVVVLAAATIFARAAWLQWSDGAAFRAEAIRPIERAMLVPAPRGRILARDGSLLAADTRSLAVAVHYRWLQEPADPTWLTRQARARLTRQERRDKAKLGAAENAVLAERAKLQERLARLCGLPLEDWQARAARVQQRIASLAEHVNQRRLERFLALAEGTREPQRAAGSWYDEVGTALTEMLAPEPAAPPAPVVLREQEEFNPLVEDVPPEVAEEIRSQAGEYPGTRIVELPQRDYPAAALAAHVVGQLGLADESENLDADSGLHDARLWVGRSGIERLEDTSLRGRPGLDVQRIDHRGRAIGLEHRRLPEPGRDVTLSLDPVLQRGAEALLDDACQHPHGAAQPEGAAAVVMDIQTGELLVSASAPRFDLRIFAAGDSTRVAALLAAENHPLVDRVAKMAIPPGSIFKTVTAVALLEEGICDPDEPFVCQGFLDSPDSQRCLLFRQQGIGHGEVTLADALARSCNVYFFHHARSLNGDRLIAWSERFGFGQRTGIDLPEEAAGHLPHPAADVSEGKRLAAAQALAIGQGQLTATPLQVVRLMAALANGGRLISPTLTKRGRSSFSPAGEQIPLKAGTLAAVQEGMSRAVDDPEGTAYASARLASVAIAGKTGTAQTAAADHAWFAGFAPAEAPRVAFVVVLEHGGPAEGAARIARALVAQMQRLGRFSDADEAPDLARD